MAEPHAVGALPRKRTDLAGVVLQLEKRLAQDRANLTHLDATMRLFDPHSRPEEIRPKHLRQRSAWFRQGECLRLIYDLLPEPMATRDLTERIMRLKAIPATDDRRRELVQKTIFGSLNRAKQTNRVS
jgi:hypothetical protein